MPERFHRTLAVFWTAATLWTGLPPAPPAVAAEQLPWCAYDDPVAFRTLRRSGGGTCPERRPGIELPETLYLPLPCGHWMAFRRVSVPARDPLAGERRVFGFPMRSGDELEAYRQALFGPWETLVSGGFSEDPEHRPLNRDYGRLAYRSYYIGKYEVTELQYELFRDGLFDRPEASDPDHEVCARAVERRIASRGRVRPAAGINVFDAFRFVEAVNAWVNAIDQDRIRRGEYPWMPWERGSPGFVRLPSEAEWELAAWGGPDFAPTKPTARRFHQALVDGSLEEPESARQIAVVFEEGRRLDVRPVGTRDPNPLELYDVLGNVEELTWDLFSAVRPDRRLAGHSGGMVARGGSYSVAESELSVGYRSEIPIYTTEGPGRSPSLGLRLAVVAPFWTKGGDWQRPSGLNPELLEALAAAREKELAAGGPEEAARLQELQKELENLRSQAQTLTVDRERLEQRLNSLASEAEQLRLRLVEAERARIRERVRSGVMLTKAIREFGGVALTVVLRLRDVEEALAKLPANERRTFRQRVAKLCENLTVRERQMDNQYDTLLGWTDELARSPQEVVAEAFDATAREFRSRRLTIYEDELELFRRMVTEARRQGGVTAEMRARYLPLIDIARSERRQPSICVRDL